MQNRQGGQLLRVWPIICVTVLAAVVAILFVATPASIAADADFYSAKKVEKDIETAEDLLRQLEEEIKKGPQANKGKLVDLGHSVVNAAGKAFGRAQVGQLMGVLSGDQAQSLLKRAEDLAQRATGLMPTVREMAGQGNSKSLLPSVSSMRENPFDIINGGKSAPQDPRFSTGGIETSVFFGPKDLVQDLITEVVLGVFRGDVPDTQRDSGQPVDQGAQGGPGGTSSSTGDGTANSHVPASADRGVPEPRSSGSSSGSSGLGDLLGAAWDWLSGLFSGSTSGGSEDDSSTDEEVNDQFSPGDPDGDGFCPANAGVTGCEDDLSGQGTGSTSSDDSGQEDDSNQSGDQDEDGDSGDSDNDPDSGDNSDDSSSSGGSDDSSDSSDNSSDDSSDDDSGDSSDDSSGDSDSEDSADSGDTSEDEESYCAAQQERCGSEVGTMSTISSSDHRFRVTAKYNTCGPYSNPGEKGCGAAAIHPDIGKAKRPTTPRKGSCNDIKAMPSPEGDCGNISRGRLASKPQNVVEFSQRERCGSRANPGEGNCDSSLNLTPILKRDVGLASR